MKTILQGFSTTLILHQLAEYSNYTSHSFIFQRTPPEDDPAPKVTCTDCHLGSLQHQYSIPNRSRRRESPNSCELPTNIKYCRSHSLGIEKGIGLHPHDMNFSARCVSSESGVNKSLKNILLQCKDPFIRQAIGKLEIIKKIAADKWKYCSSPPEIQPKSPSQPPNGVEQRAGTCRMIAINPLPSFVPFYSIPPCAHSFTIPYHTIPFHTI